MDEQGSGACRCRARVERGIKRGDGHRKGGGDKDTVNVNPDWCPVFDPLPDNWYTPVTVLPEDYFNVQFELELKRKGGELSGVDSEEKE